MVPSPSSFLILPLSRSFHTEMFLSCPRYQRRGLSAGISARHPKSAVIRSGLLLTLPECALLTLLQFQLCTQSHQMSVYIERPWFLWRCDPGPTSTASSSFPLVTGRHRRRMIFLKWLQHIAVICSNLQLFHWLFWPFGQAYQPRLECLKTCPEGEGNAQSWQSIELWQLRHGMAASLPCCVLCWDWDWVESCWVMLSLLHSVESVESPTSRPMQPISRLRLRFSKFRSTSWTI